MKIKEGPIYRGLNLDVSGQKAGLFIPIVLITFKLVAFYFLWKVATFSFTLITSHLFILDKSRYYWVFAIDRPSFLTDLASIVTDGLNVQQMVCQNGFTICCNRWFIYVTDKTSDATFVLSIATDGQYVGGDVLISSNSWFFSLNRWSIRFISCFECVR